MTELISPKKSIVFDATTLTTLMTCGRYLDLRMNRQFAPSTGKANALETGSLVHKYLETYYKSIIHGMDKKMAHEHGMASVDLYIKSCPYCTGFVEIHSYTLEEQQFSESNGTPLSHTVCNENCVLKPKCGHPPNEYPGLTNTPPDNSVKPSRIGWLWVLDSCEQYYKHYLNDYWVPLETEVVKRKVIYEDENIRILWKGKLDLITDTNQGIYPVDHKTMKQNRDIVSMNNQFMGQCILMNTQGMMVNKFGFQTSLKPEEKFTRVLIPYSQDRLFEWYSEIVPYWAYQLIEYTESGYFPPNFTQCEGKFGPCIMQGICKADRNMREEELRQHFIVAPKWDIDNVED